MAENIITDEDIKPENIRVTISMRMPGDLLDAYRARAEQLGIPYQTYMQMKLREGLERDNLDARISALESAIAKDRAA